MLYAQATSPIRRMCDLVNTIAIKHACAIGAPCAGATTLSRNWLARINDVSRAAKAARRLQSECELLSRCAREREEDGQAGTPTLYVGVPIEKEMCPAYSTACFRYTVHLADLQHVVRVDSDDDLPLLVPRSFSLHVFLDEARRHRKVRVAAA